jgi:Leucine-rich repeat (LRR) protein
MIANNIHHFCYYPLDNFKANFDIISNSYIKLNRAFSGCFYCFTEEVIRELGHLPVLDKKYGYEHECFTKKVIKYNYDIINASKYINLIQLWCHYNKICKIPSTYTKLTSLLCCNNPIKELPPELVNLENIICSDTEIKEIPSTYKKLLSLNCSNSTPLSAIAA